MSTIRNHLFRTYEFQIELLRRLKTSKHSQKMFTFRHWRRL